jgi:hypothetical protein
MVGFRWLRLNASISAAALALCWQMSTCDIAICQNTTIAKNEAQPLKCDARLDSESHKVLIIVDLTQLNVTKQVTKVQIPVEFVDKQGKALGVKQFAFVDPEQQDSPLSTGKYSRRFEYDQKAFPTVWSVRPLESHALVVTELKAAKPTD